MELKPTIRSYGSYVTADLSKYVTKVSFKNNIGKNSILTAEGDRISCELVSNHKLKPWEEKIVLLDLDKGIKKFLAEYGTDFVVIDLIDERYDLIKVDDSYFLKSMQFTIGGYEDQIMSAYTRTTPLVLKQSELSKEFVRAKINSFCDMLKKFYPVENIIIVKAKMVYEYIDEHGEIKAFDRKNIITEFNKYIECYYKCLEEELKGCHIIEMPEKTIADPKHRWGLQPYHYTPDFYKTVAADVEKYIQQVYSENNKISCNFLNEEKIERTGIEKMTNAGTPGYLSDFWHHFLRQFDCRGKTILQIGTPIILNSEQLLEFGIKNYIVLTGIESKKEQSKPDKIKTVSFAADNYVSWRNLANDCRCICYTGDENDIRQDWVCSFDAVISCSYIEHCVNVSNLFKIAYQCLKNGGLLYMQGGPIWSSWNGTKWRVSNNLNFTNSNAFEYAHLLNSIKEISEKLETLGITENVSLIAENIKHGAKYFNKLHYEDYQYIFQQTLFKEKSLFVKYRKDVPPDFVGQIEKISDKYKRYDVSSVLLYGRK